MVDFTREEVETALEEYSSTLIDEEDEFIDEEEPAESSTEEEETEENLSDLNSEFTQLCKENKIEDVSANEEHLLTYALFPNIALRFFKNLLNK